MPEEDQMIVLSDYVVPKSGSYVSQCQHQVERYFERGRRFSLCPRGCRRVGWMLKGSQYEIGIRATPERADAGAADQRTVFAQASGSRIADTLPPPGARRAPTAPPGSAGDPGPPAAG